MSGVQRWGVSELSKWGLLPNNDPRVIAITKRWLEARSKNARWCEAVSAKDAEIERLRNLVNPPEELERLEAPMDESAIDAFLKMDDDQQLNAYADLYYKLAVRDATIGHLTASLAEALGSPHPARDVIAECNVSLAAKDSEIERLKKERDEARRAAVDMYDDWE